ncbi:hypothetical protein BKA59DRAFT_481557 [Fusarium tricinctum]|uniref:RING-type domain-containing protein n=1 Tax=Fusarium tricinctum TaxID=61284 RepID=A0A8K0RQW9_9HYPO|nr:hypothetical protein BKA59DRAFT_481557 [Fusarium tricinctum]
MSTKQNKQEKCSETYWPLLKEQLSSSKVTFDDLELTCNICYDTMGTQPSDQFNEAGTHGARILPCGHMFGYCCLRQSYEATLDGYSDMSACCPTCRASVVHSTCRHIHPGQKMPTCLEDLDCVAGPIKDGQMIATCKNCIADLHLDLFRQCLDIETAFNSDRDINLDLCLRTRTRMYTAHPVPPFGEEVPVPELTAKAFREMSASQKRIETGEFQAEMGCEGAWCEEPLSDGVLTCFITGSLPPKPLPFWEFADYQNLQDKRDGVALKTVEELRAIYDAKS